MGQSDGAAEAGVIGIIFRERYGGDALADIRLDQDMRLAIGLRRAIDRADIERGMRPCRLREIFDDAGDAVVAFDQQHVAGLDQAAQPLWIARRKGFIAWHLFLEVAGDDLADGIEHKAHWSIPPSGMFRPLSCWLIVVESNFNLVHASSLPLIKHSP